MAGFCVGSKLNLSLHFMRSIWYTSSGEKRAAHAVRPEERLTWVGRDRGVALRIVELERVNALSVFVEEVAKVHFCFIINYNQSIHAAEPPGALSPKVALSHFL